MKIYQRYITYFAGSALILSVAYILLFNALTAQGLEVPKMPYEALYDYQAAKAAHSDARTAFVGDSALGNAINAQLYTELSGQKTVNLALTGKFGYRGSFEMLKTLHAHDPHLQTVIIMQTPDMMRRDVAPAYEKPARVLGLDVGVFNLNTLGLFARALYDGAWNTGKQQDSRIVNDYMPQSPAKRGQEHYEGFSAKDIRPAKLEFLKRTAAYCKAQNLRCLYAHAPITEEICRTSAAYINAVNAMIRETGLDIAPGTPLCIPPEKLGDSSDHVRPENKDEFTRGYYEALTTGKPPAKQAPSQAPAR